MNIILLGYMTSGKSLIGEKLSGILKKSFQDLDDYIENKEGLSISDIFKTKGEIYFRKIEAKHLETFLQQKDMILSLGGGTPCYGGNMALIKQQPNNKSIYLNVSVAELGNRLFLNKANRPLVAHLKTQEETTEFVGKHIFERLNFYNQADLSINANKSLDDIIEDILLKLI
ncbi:MULTISPECIES: shikimate kinase [Bizionia]|uniref:Shikimate kinase n=1 Tax=Bizionia algoritergicola TaxID=291187 RepID=A0A5D0QTU1_9FLAO|nr:MULTISPECIES: shikimate kinase [Bizionia]OBX17495.1 shikimate kinase [Bizionia sp. APA-3]TYB72121.1 shikimate kinase [Bizionia algoritergicola]